MREYEFSKQDTSIAKGVAILMMVLHHTFTFPERIKVTWFPILGSKLVFGHNLEFLIGEFGKLCVSIFVFLTGYGIYKVYERKRTFTIKDSFKRVYHFYKGFWVVAFIFIPLGYFFVFNRYNWYLSSFKFDFTHILANILLVSNSFNSEWWFATFYILLLLCVPVVIKLVNTNIKTALVSSVLIVFFYYNYTMPMNKIINGLLSPISGTYGYDVIYYLYSMLLLVLKYFLAFVLGMIFSKLNLFKRIDSLLGKNILWSFLGLIILIYIRVITSRTSIPIMDVITDYQPVEAIDFILAPLFIYCSVKVIHSIKLTKLFDFFGENSMNVWLTHTFFVYYYFQWISFYPKYSFLIYLWILILSFTVSIILKYIYNIFSIILKRFKIISKL